MANSPDSPIRSPHLLDVTTYLTVAAMSLLGISGLDDFRLQAAAFGVCLLFALLHRFVYQSGRVSSHPAVYFGAQAVLMGLLFSLGSRNTDAFNFLFIFLAIHAAIVLPIRSGALWIAVYFGIVTAHTLIDRGLDGLYAIVFYLVTYTAAGAFGQALRQAELSHRRIEQLLAELRSAQQQLQELAVLEERNRLARDLHDSVKQQVFAISMQLGAARATLEASHPAYPAVVEAERLAKQAGTELTSLIRELRPPGLERKPLADALRSLVHDWARSSGIAADMIASGQPELPVSIENELYRFVQEGLANVARHSGAAHAWVALSGDDAGLTLTIEDDGAGFDEDRVAKGVGLDSMRERLAAIGGTVAVSRRAVSGTRLVATVRREMR